MNSLPRAVLVASWWGLCGALATAAEDMTAGHYIQRDKPDVVVDTVREIAGCR
jgi:hypothetical protein